MLPAVGSFAKRSPVEVRVAAMILALVLFSFLGILAGSSRDSLPVGVQLCHRSRQVHKRQCHSWQPSRRFFRVRAAGLGVKMLPCIQRLVEDAKRMPCIAERHKGRTRAFFMKTGTPAALPDATVERCWHQLQTKNLQELHALLTQHGLVKEMADGNKKMVYEAFCESWVEHCCVIHEQHRSRSTQVGDVQCSCWHYRRRGHCPHAYFVLQSRLGFKSWVPEVLPSAKAAPDALDMQSGGSSVEASKPGRSRKRPDYRPVPLPCPDVAVGEAARPVTKPRILQPQRAAKTRFSR